MFNFLKCLSDAEEKFNLKKSIHDKKGSIGRANALEEVEEIEHYDNHNYGINNMNTCLDNLAVAATQNKDVTCRLVSTNKNLANHLEKLFWDFIFNKL